MISPGAEFPDAIREKLAESDIVIVVIGPRWLSCVDQEGTRRLDSADDWVRREIAIALQGEGLVVPVLVGGATIPASAEVPAELRDLVVRQAWELDPATFRQDVQSLAERLKKALKEAEAKRRERERKKRAQLISEQIDEYKSSYFPLRPFEYPWWVLFFVSAILLSAFSSIVHVPTYLKAAIQLKHAEEAADQKQFPDAITAYENVLELTPSSKRAKLGVAYSLFARGQDDDHYIAMDYLEGLTIAKHDWEKLTSVMPAAYQDFFTQVER